MIEFVPVEVPPRLEDFYWKVIRNRLRDGFARAGVPAELVYGETKSSFEDQVRAKISLDWEAAMDEEINHS